MRNTNKPRPLVNPVPAYKLMSGCKLLLPVNDGSGTKLIDYSGNKNNGLINSGIVWSGSDALYLNGSSGLVSITNVSGLNITDDLTISFWIKTTSTTANIGLIQFGYAPTSIDYFSLLLNRTTSGKFDIYCGSGSWQINANNTNINDGSWHHVVTAGSGTAGKVYIDGMPKGTFTFAGRTYSTAVTLYLGSYFGTSGFLAGNLDDIRIFNRELSASDVSELYNNQWSAWKRSRNIKILGAI